MGVEIGGVVVNSVRAELLVVFEGTNEGVILQFCDDNHESKGELPSMIHLKKLVSVKVPVLTENVRNFFTSLEYGREVIRHPFPGERPLWYFDDRNHAEELLPFLKAISPKMLEDNGVQPVCVQVFMEIVPAAEKLLAKEMQNKAQPFSWKKTKRERATN